MRSVSCEEAGQYISAFGNENILKNLVCYFEKRAQEEISNSIGTETEHSMSIFPNFAVWLRLYAELITNNLVWKLFRYEGNEEILRPGKSSKFSVMKDTALNIIKDQICTAQIIIAIEELNLMKKSLNLVINLRHSFQHGGLPNRMRDLSDECDEKEFYNMLVPHNFMDTKKIFESAESLMKLVPQPIITVY